MLSQVRVGQLATERFLANARCVNHYYLTSRNTQLGAQVRPGKAWEREDIQGGS